MTATLIILSISFGFYCIVRELFKVHRTKTFLLVNIVGMMYGVTYGFLPAGFLIGSNPRLYGLDFSDNGILFLTIWFSAAVLGYFVLQKVYYWKKLKFTIQKDKPSLLTYRRMEFTLILCFIIGVVSLYLWTQAYGGIGNLILVANAVRSGRGDIENSLAFFKHPARIVIFCSYLSLYLVKKRYMFKTNIILFLISTLLSVLFLLANDGRMPFAFFLLTLLLMYINFFELRKTSIKKIGSLMIYGIMMLFLIFYMDYFTRWIRSGEWDLGDNNIEVEVGEDVGFEFSYILRSAQYSTEEYIDHGSPNLIGHDIGLGFFAWLPTSFKPKGLINIWDYNTEKVQHHNFLYGQQPTDLVSTGFYDLGISGVIFWAMFWGVCLYKLDRHHVLKQTPFHNVLYYALLYYIVRIVNYSSCYYLLLSLFNLFVAIVIWKLSKILLRK